MAKEYPWTHDEAHEQRVQRHWRKAATQWLTTRITRTTKRFLIFSYQEIDLPMTEETVVPLVGFMTDHLDMPEHRIRETVASLKQEARETERSSKGRSGGLHEKVHRMDARGDHVFRVPRGRGGSRPGRGRARRQG